MGTGNPGETVSQSFATVIGDGDVVDFYLAVGAYQGGTTPNLFRVDFGATNLLNQTDLSAQGWTHYAFTTTATASSTTLTFDHQMSPSWFILDGCR